MSQQPAQRQRSILEDLGEEVTAIITPVSICMALTVMLVKTLNPTGASDVHSVLIASAFYTEQEGDSSSQKTIGAVINASIFVVVVTMMTFLLVFLFKRGYTRFIYGYMAFAGFSIFFVLAGILLLQLLETFGMAMDAFSYLFILYNFAVVGLLGLFVWPAPMTLKQIYLTITGVIVAFVFTWTPEWTTWTLLIAMAIYDLFAVLMPGGPLKELVQIAEERQVDIPALVYEARPVRRNGEQYHDVTTDSAWAHRARPCRTHNALGDTSEGLDEAQDNVLQPARHGHDIEQLGPGAQAVHVEAGAVGGWQMPVVQPTASDSPGPGRVAAEQQPRRQPASGQPPPANAHSHQPQRPSPLERRQPPHNPPHDDDALMLPDAIKLGLGDFIFYSVLVGRAAMYDMLTAYMAYLAIVAGLGATLLLLALYQKALPALPVSIALGVAFYFAARLLLEPFVLPLSMQLVIF